MSSRTLTSIHVEDDGVGGRVVGPEPKRPRMAFKGDIGMPNAVSPEYAA